MKQSSMDQWIGKKLGLEQLERCDIEKWQLTRASELIEYSRRNSPFYRTLYHNLTPVRSMDDFYRYPLIDSSILKGNGQRMLCVSQGIISRIVTLETSGTTDQPKRIFFTGEDQELTIDFFHYGMRTLAGPGGRVMIFLPCRTKGNVGDLLARGLERDGIETVRYGLISDLGEAAEVLQETEANVLVGIPVQILALSLYCRENRVQASVSNVLLSTDQLPDIVRERIEENFGCQVFDHFGMTESGLGGALECEAHQGMHIRENDLLFEIIDPESGQTLPDGQYGELVLTTLTRQGMPLLRYRTGDYTRILEGECPCGSVLKRIESIHYRNSGVDGSREERLNLRQLDEVIFAIDRVIDYMCNYDTVQQKLRLKLLLFRRDKIFETAQLCTALRRLHKFQNIELKVEITDRWLWPYSGKRKIAILE